MSLLFAGLTILVGVPVPKGDSEPTLPTLVGDWALESVLAAGSAEPIPPAAVLTFGPGGKCRMKEPKADKPTEMSYKADNGRIDLQDLGKDGKLILGIYKIEEDTLTLCLSAAGDRPTAFNAPAGSEHILVKLKRSKKR